MNFNTLYKSIFLLPVSEGWMVKRFYYQIKTDIELIFSAFQREGSFVKNFSYLLGGKFVIVLLMLVTTPFLTRLYTPEAYGYFSFLNAVATNFATFASLGYPLAMVLAPTSKEFYNLMVLSLLLMIIACLIISGVLIFFSNLIIPFPATTDSNVYLLFLIASCLIFSLMNIFPRWNAWRNQFRQGASINVLVNIGSRTTSLAIGFFSSYQFGIIAGELTGKVLGLIANLKINFFKEWNDIKELVRKEEIILVLKKYKDYPRYILTSNYLSGVIGQIPIFIFPFFFEVNILGSYSLAIGMLSLPVLLISVPLSTVFLKKISDLKQKDEHQVSVFVERLFKGLALISILPFVVLTVWAPDLFMLIFGQQWERAGFFASILAFYGMFEFLQVSLQGTMLVHKKEKALFRYSLFQVALILMLFLPGILRNEPVEAILGYTVARVIGSLVMISNFLTVSKIKPGLLLIKLCSLFLLMFLGFKGIDFILVK